MKGYLIPDEDVNYLDDLLLKNGLLQVVPSSLLAEVKPMHLSLWGNKRGIYCLPTIELIDWLREQIGGKSAIEICSGNGAIGRALNIPRTDSYIQTTPEIIEIYRAAGQVPIVPPEDVQKFEANEAVDYFNPEVVIGAYVTQKFVEGDRNGSAYGTDEVSLLKKVKKYIVIGNDESHGEKRIRRLPYKQYRFSWLFTRSLNQQSNEISIWEKT